MCNSSRDYCRFARTANGSVMRRKSGNRSSAMSKSDQRRSSVTATVRSATRSTSVRRLKNFSVFALVLLTVGPSGRPAVAQSRPISDNSFLIEEAYTKELGVVQHISAWQRTLSSAAWAYTFTQEWPVGTQAHQLSYTILLHRTESPSRTGLGDAALNYRYQLRRAEAPAAIAPRPSLVFPTGRAPPALRARDLAARPSLGATGVS